MVRIAREITRFTSRKDIDSLFKHARSICIRPGIRILRAPTNDPVCKILIIAPARIGSAPQRNKIRRQIRSIFYQQRLFTKGFHCIALLKPGCLQLSFAQLQALLVNACAPLSPIS